MTDQPRDDDRPRPLAPASPVRKTAVRAAQAGVNVIWLVPIVALIVTIGVAWTAYSDRGTVIEVEFADATGITPGETVLRFREITVGQVDSVAFSKDLTKVVVSIRVDQDVAQYIDSDASFWIVRPQVTAQGVSRLDTVLSGAFIEGYWDATVAGEQTRFTGLESPPLIREDKKGTWFILTSDKAEGLSEGAPILHRGVEVGRLENLRLTSDGNSVEADAFIEAPHDKKLTTATAFWNTSGFSVSLGANGLSLNVNSLASLLQGGVSFDTLSSGGKPVERGHSFALQPDEDTARSNIFIGEDGDRLRLTMLIDDSVSGLNQGADVQFQGLRVGQVVDMAVLADEDAGADGGPLTQQQVTFAISPARLGLPRDATPEDALEFLQAAVADGVRARVASDGFLGTRLKIELVPIPDAAPATIDTEAQPFPRIPSVEGDLDDFSATAQGLMTRVGELPIEEVLASARDMMNSITAIASSQETRAIPAALRGTLDKAGSTIEDVGGMAKELRDNNTAKTVSRLVDEAAAAAEAIKLAAADVPDMVDQIDAAAASVDEFDFAAISAQAEGILADLRAMLGSEDAEQLPRDLSDTLEAAAGLLNDLRDGNAAGSLNSTLRSINTAADQLPSLLRRLEGTATRADGVLAAYGDRSQFNAEAINMLRELRRATAAFGSLARLIERNPQAFILGR